MLIQVTPVKYLSTNQLKAGFLNNQIPGLLDSSMFKAIT